MGRDADQPQEVVEQTELWVEDPAPDHRRDHHRGNHRQIVDGAKSDAPADRLVEQGSNNQRKSCTNGHGPDSEVERVANGLQIHFLGEDVDVVVDAYELDRAEQIVVGETDIEIIEDRVDLDEKEDEKRDSQIRVGDKRVAVDDPADSFRARDRFRTPDFVGWGNCCGHRCPVLY